MPAFCPAYGCRNRNVPDEHNIRNNVIKHGKLRILQARIRMFSCVNCGKQINQQYNILWTSTLIVVTGFTKTSTETLCQWEWCSKSSSRTSTSVVGSSTAWSAVATSRCFSSNWSVRWTARCSSPGDSKMPHQWLSYVLLWTCVRSYSLSHHCQLSELWVSSFTICFFCASCIEFS